MEIQAQDEQRNVNFRRASCLSMLTVLAIWAVLAAFPAAAQTTFGSILGTVTDQTGAALSGTTVTLTNVGTADHRTVQTDNNGSYQFVNLTPGTYSLDFEKTGFQRVKRESIPVVVQSAVRVNASLQVGNVNQTVNVEAAAPIIETQPGPLGQTVEGRVVQEMPLNGRNVFNLLTLAPGVVAQGSTSGSPLGNQAGGTFTNNTGWGNYQIGGGMANQSAFFLDGVPLNTPYANNTSLVPTQDAIQEFRVESNAVDAEFGRFAGGVVNMATKSGSDQFHGSAYEYIRNKVLNANNFFNNRNGLDRPAFTQNQYGVTSSGPVVRNKLFYFFSFEGFALRNGRPTITTVPTAAMRKGDFSELRDSKGNLIPIYDPLTTCGLAGTPACPAGQTTTRQAFPNNQIPSNRFDPTSAAFMNFWGQPNRPGIVNNFVTNVSLGGNTTQYNGRVDWNVSDKQRIFARYTRWSGNSLPSDPFHVNFGGLKTIFGTQNIVIGDSYTFSPTTIADLHVSYLRPKHGFFPQQLGIDLSQFGANWVTLGPQLASGPLAPVASVSGFAGFSQVYNPSIGNDYAVSGSVSKILGRHTLKFGGEVRRNEWYFGQSSTGGGQFTFNQTFTALNPLDSKSASSTGYSFASFLLGYPASGTLQNVVFSDAFQWYSGLYLQDSFRVNPRLTVNMGVRWDLPRGFVEKNDRLTVLLPDATDPLGQQVGMNLKGQMALVNSPLYPDKTQTTTRYKLFQPRLGIAYSARDNTVIRAGYGLSYVPSDMISYNQAPFQSPVNNAVNTMVTSLNGGLTPASTFFNPFPQGLIEPIGHDPSQLGIYEGQSIRSPIPTEPIPYIQQWNLELQQQLKGGLAMTVGYAGSKATHLDFNPLELDQLPDQYLSRGADLNTQVPNPFYGHLPASAGLLARPTVAKGQLLRPFPQYQSFSDASASFADSNYHSLQVRVVKHVGSGLIQGSYTWAKLLSNTDTLTSWLEADHSVGGIQDYYNLAAEKSLASFNVAHRFVGSFVVGLPFGPGHLLLGNSQGFLAKLIGGWSANGIVTLQSGLPLRIATSQNLTNSFGGGSRPNVVPGVDRQSHGSEENLLNQWFNPAAFAQPAAFTFGNESRVDPVLKGDGISNVDFTLVKAIPLTERLNFQFRTEVFNLFNHVQFGDPGTSLGANNFGVVTSQQNNPRLIQFGARLVF
jgi:hypothetical protein